MYITLDVFEEKLTMRLLVALVTHQESSYYTFSTLMF